MTYISSRFYCTSCGDFYDIPRIYKQRGKYHLKTLYCRFCRKDQIFIEVRECDHDLQSDKAITYGVLKYFYETYGYDFLKIFIWFPQIENLEELHYIINYINGCLSGKELECYFNLIKQLSIAVKESKDGE